jgi:hypothetical protein
MTRGVLRTKVNERLLAAGQAPFTNVQVEACLNEGLWLFSLLTLSVERQADLVLRADEPQRRILEEWPEFLVPLRVECVRRVLTDPGATWDGSLWDSQQWGAAPVFTETLTQVRASRLRELAARDPEWMLARNATVERYALQGVDLLSIYPCPADADTALRITHAAQAQTLADDNQEPEIPAEYHPALISYALATLPLAQGGSELARFAGEWRIYVLAVQECAAWVRSRARGRGYDTQPFPIVLPEPKKAKGGTAA